jgi:hypothetical protein
MPVKRTTEPKAAKRPTVRRKKKPVLTEEQIATRAYYLHLEGGADDVGNWLRAERELATA